MTVTKNVDVAEVFNKFFVNVALDIGKDYTFNKNYHPSLQKIEASTFLVTILSLFCKIILD
jgi:hypothetical protein